MVASAILKIRKIAISRPRFERFRQNLAWLHSSTLLTVPNIKNFKFWKSKLWIDMHRSFNINEHLTEQHWQPVFLFSKPGVSIHVFCSYIELSRSKLHKTGDLQVGNWHVNCQHSSYTCFSFIRCRVAIVVIRTRGKCRTDLAFPENVVYVYNML